LIKEIDTPCIFESADAVAASGRTRIELIWFNTRELLKEPGVNEYLLVIDEIQKIDNWSEIVKRLWDEDMRNGVNLIVILLGSSRLLIQQRAFRVACQPFRINLSRALGLCRNRHRS